MSEKAFQPLIICFLLFLTVLTLAPSMHHVNSAYFATKIHQAYEPLNPTEKSLKQTTLVNLPLEQVWNRTYSQSSFDLGHAIIECQMGGYAIAGVTQQGVDASDLLLNLLVLRLDASGNLLWRSSFGGNSFDEGNDIVECQDGGFAILGYTLSSDSTDIFLVRTDHLGNQLWNRTFDIGGVAVGYSIIRCRVGGFAVIGRIGYSQAWLIRLDEGGMPLWNQTYETSPPFADDTLVECRDGGFAFIGNTEPSQLADVILVRTDANGILLWNETYGGAGSHFSRGLVQCRDGGFALAGGIRSIGTFDNDIWLVRTDPLGRMIWNTSIGGVYNEFAESIIETWLGNFALTGSVILRSGFYDVPFIMASPSGQVLLNWTFGGSQHDRGYSLIECQDRGFAITGTTYTDERGWDVLLIRIPGDENQNMFHRMAWIGMTIVLPLLVSLITVWLMFRLLRPKQTQRKTKNRASVN